MTKSKKKCATIFYDDVKICKNLDICNKMTVTSEKVQLKKYTIIENDTNVVSNLGVGEDLGVLGDTKIGFDLNVFGDSTLSSLTIKNQSLKFRGLEPILNVQAPANFESSVVFASPSVFDTLPISNQIPTEPNQLVTKSYADSIAGSTGPKGNDGSLGPTGVAGPTGVTGSQGLGTFNMEILSGSPVILRNSIDTGEGNVVVRVSENFYPAFISFQFNYSLITSPSIIGFVNINYVNTFAFSLQFESSGNITLNYNRGGAISTSYTYTNGDYFALVLTESQCYYYQNFNLIGVYPNTSTSFGETYYGQFYLNDANIFVNNISNGIEIPPIITPGTNYSDYLYWNTKPSGGNWEAGTTSQNDNAIAIGYSTGNINQGTNSISIGTNAGQSNQNSSSIAMGLNAGQENQSNQAIAIGITCGQINQGISSIAIGTSSGYSNQGSNSIGIGSGTGQNGQSNDSIAIGHNAGNIGQNYQSISLGYFAGYSNQGISSISIGTSSGGINQGGSCIAIGSSAGEHDQLNQGIAIGANSGQCNQQTSAIAIGWQAGLNSQGTNSISIGPQSAFSNQDSNAIAIGNNSGYSNQGTEAIAIGKNSGINNQGIFSIAIGSDSGKNSQNVKAIAIGLEAGSNIQELNAIAIGYQAGNNNQKINAVAIGSGAGYFSQGSNTVAISTNAGYSSQNDFAVAIGTMAGTSNQKSNAIAIGYMAGFTNQGQYSIAIGNKAGETDQSPNSIIINANSSSLNTTTSGLFINPIRQEGTSTGNIVVYNNSSKEVYVDSSKSFVINHPEDIRKYIVHACLEGPEAGIYYRGKATITNNVNVEIELPRYVKYIGKNFTIQLTKIYSNPELFGQPLETTEVIDGKFKVYGSNCRFYWMVQGERNEIIVEPNKDEYILKGDGPYTYITKK